MHERIVDQRRDIYRKEAWKPIDRYGYVSHEALYVWGVVWTSLLSPCMIAGFARSLKASADRRVACIYQRATRRPFNCAEGCQQLGSSFPIDAVS